MFGGELLYDTISQALAGMETVERLDVGDDPNELELVITDFLPGGEEAPWVARITRSEDFVHPLLGDRYPCIEFALPLMAVPPDIPGYLDIIGANAGPCLDHQRFCFGASVTWEPDSGQIAIYSQLRLVQRSTTDLVTELNDRLRNLVALVYLTSFRIWQLQLRHKVPGATSDPVIETVWRRMMALLGAPQPPLPPGA